MSGMFNAAPRTDVTGNKEVGTSEGPVVGRGCFTFWLCMCQFHLLISIQTSKSAELGKASAFLVPALEPSHIIRHTPHKPRPTQTLVLSPTCSLILGKTDV